MMTGTLKMMTIEQLSEALRRELEYERQLEAAGLPTSEQHRLVATIRVELSERLGLVV
jgi:hypothetical protein